MERENPNYKPNVQTDKKYLDDVSKLISNEKKEEIRFDTLNAVFRLVDVTDNIFADITLDNLNPASVKEKVSQAFNAVNAKELQPEILEALHQAWDYLAESDTLEKADLAFVFGGANTDRVDEAVRLFKEGYVPCILFTGQKASYMERTDLTEADYYADLARAQGVPEQALILEQEARNTPENVVNSYKILSERGIVPSKVIIITLPYHMRRAYYTFKAASTGNPEVIRDTVPSVLYTRDNYYRSEEAFNYVCSEFIKIYGARLMGHF